MTGYAWRRVVFVIEHFSEDVRQRAIRPLLALPPECCLVLGLDLILASQQLR